MRKASRKPLVMRRSVLSPLRSSSALVATVVPIFHGADALARNSIARREAEEMADAVHRGVPIGFGIFPTAILWVRSAPSGRLPITSVKVPPRSIQNSQLDAMRSIPTLFYATLDPTEPVTRLVEDAAMHKIAIFASRP